MHQCHGEEKKGKYKVLGLPYKNSSYGKTMKLRVNDAVLEMPYTTSDLRDDFTSFLASCVIAETEFTIDVDDFIDEMFDGLRQCHC